MGLTLACLLGLFASVGGGPEDSTVTYAIGVALCGIVAHGWVAFTVRCPSCRRRIGFLVLTQMGTSQWLVQLWRGDSCPACGDPGPAGSA